MRAAFETLTLAVALLAAAAWVRAPDVSWVIVCSVATIVAMVLTWRHRDWWARLTALMLGAFCLVAAFDVTVLMRARHDWPAYSSEIEQRSTQTMRETIDRTTVELQSIARKALMTPRTAAGAFRMLQGLLPSGIDCSVALFANDTAHVPFAWAGVLRAPIDVRGDPITVVQVPFYTNLQVTATDGVRHATVSVLIHADPPANHLASPLDAHIAARTDVLGFDVVDSIVPLTLAPIMPSQAEAVLHLTERVQRRGVLLVAIALLLFLVGEWRPRRFAVPRRVTALFLALGMLAVIPLNTFSNVSPLFDPTYFFLAAGGLYTANVGALILAGGVVLLAALALARARWRGGSPVFLTLCAVALVVAAPFVMLQLARGITPPGAGVPLVVWVGWQVALALVGTAMLVCAAALVRRRVFARWRVIAPTIVAGLGAAIVVWGSMAHRRLELAERDVRGLAVADADAEALLERFAVELALAPPADTRADLLELYARSDLASANYPVTLTEWEGDPELQAPKAELSLAKFRSDEQAVIEAAIAARRQDTAILTEAVGSPGMQLILAVPHAPQSIGDFWSVTTVVVAPQTKLIGETSLGPLLGLPADTSGTPLYSVSLIEGGQTVPELANQQLRWRRTGSTLHADWVVRTLDGPARAHVEVELRPLDALAERAVLLLVVDLLVVGCLWGISVIGDGVLWRWTRLHMRRWRYSYRTRLTVVLFGFFVVPTVGFTIWSERRLRSDEVEARTLRVAEMLRSVAAENALSRLVSASMQLGMPLLLYDQGILRATSDTLYAELAPLGLLLRPDIEQDLGRGNEVVASRSVRLGDAQTLVGYRAATLDDGRHVVLAAPEEADEEVLERRSVDLNILLLFATVVGATAAWWLSGLAARELARPIDELRRAALAMAAGEREPPLAGNPPVEFAPVFSAFRRMAADFGASQRVLAWGEMARQVAHEIKNPLTPIRLGVQHLLRAWRSGRKDFDKILETNAGRILGEIDRLDEIARAFSRYGTAPAERALAESTDVAAVVRDVVALERLGGSGSAVIWELVGDMGPVLAMARAEELREVLLNVLENARLAHARRVVVLMECVEVARASRAIVTVEDDGEGIAPEVLPRIFEPHFSTRTSGSGLGLAVSRRIVEGWGGTITVTSERGRGTRVTIILASALLSEST